MKDEWFCFPDGIHLRASDDRPHSSLSSFIKCCSGVKSYGLLLTMYFPANFNIDALEALLRSSNDEDGDRTSHIKSSLLQHLSQSHAGCKDAFPLWIPVCVCLISRVPVIHALMDWLRGFQLCLESIECKNMSSRSVRDTVLLVDNHDLQAAIFQLVR